MITPENLVRHELIGLLVEVVEGRNPAYVGISGRVVDETRNTFLIETGSGDKRVPKSSNRFLFTLSQGLKVKAEGSVLVSQPENRINKKIRRSRWKL
ncbi:ribonuclease P protein component 1 [Candidatus Methanocrinis natronophilus]|uniref:Ribonuclease P protein component 1 n=1 Tax=Candidatus Methanocrinis natronophilus TaxID=3033396 RepID=A0ABT5X8A9_9EURY|nr:ribonuclease P protein component 1 [Candidatus Methanocrinis natronophilus]MDF0590893.1 ribonuclease P protein component 1 [Candidatus Methanocrinis natronophilus]